jgi:hypothetical protein
MIRLRTRPKEEVKKFKTYPGKWEIDNEILNSVYYYEKDGQEFLYLGDLHLFFIPESCNLSVSDILGDTEVDISDWTLTKTGEGNPGYTLNQLKLGSIYYKDYNKLFKDEDTGTWVLENKECGTRLEFYMRLKKESWDDMSIILLGYPEETQVPYSKELVKRKGCFMITLFYLWKKKQLGISSEE